MLTYKRPALILGIVALILLIPFTAMQFTQEVNWSLFDFLVAAGLLLIAGFAIDFAIGKTKAPNSRILLVTAIVVVFFLVWAELAVGVFGTPFAGN